MREAGIVTSPAVLVAVGIDGTGGARSWLWRSPIARAARPGGARLKGVELAVSGDHAGLVAAIGEVIPEAAGQRCHVDSLRSALDHLPSEHGDDWLQELRWLYDRRDLAEAKVDLAAWLSKWSPRYPRLTGWQRCHRADANLLPTAASAPQTSRVHGCHRQA